MDSGAFPAGNQRFEDLLLGHSHGMGCVLAVQIIFVIRIECFPAGNPCLLCQPDSIGF